MSEVKSYRKPYNPPVHAATWWTQNSFYKMYMLRELTAVTALFFVLEVVLGLFLFAMCKLDVQPATAESAAPYLWWLQSFLGNPVILVLNVITLFAQLFHVVTWFNLMPKAVRVFMNKNSTERLPDYVVKGSLYLATIGATVVILVFAFATI